MEILKSFKKLSLIGVFALAFGIVLLISTDANAQNNQDAGRLSYTISPPSFEISADPGEIVSNVLKVTNSSASTITFETKVEDFRVEGQEGIVQLQSDQDNPNAFSKWFRIEPSTFTLKEGETRSINFRVSVPDDGEPGGHFASVLIQPKTIASVSGSGAQVLQRVGTLVLMKVSGEVAEKGAITSFSAKNFIGNYETVVQEDGSKVFSPRDEKLEEETKKSYFQGGPIAFDLLFKNDGNVFYRPQGTVTIYNIFGKKVDEVKIEGKNVFPGGERRITVLWPKKNLWGVRYTAKLDAIYGSKNELVQASTSFWGFPMPVAITLLVLIVVFGLLRKRLAKAIRIIAKG